MADFAQIKDGRGLTLWINLDYVTRIRPGLDPREQTTMHFAVGRPRSLAISAADGGKLLGQLNRCCRKRER
jgi:hypothetical protein